MNSEETLKECPRCNSKSKISAIIVFGYLTLQCKDCGFKITSERRSGSIGYLLGTGEMRKRWNEGIEDKDE